MVCALVSVVVLEKNSNKTASLLSIWIVTQEKKESGLCKSGQVHLFWLVLLCGLGRVNPTWSIIGADSYKLTRSKNGIKFRKWFTAWVQHANGSRQHPTFICHSYFYRTLNLLLLEFFINDVSVPNSILPLWLSYYAIVIIWRINYVNFKWTLDSWWWCIWLMQWIIGSCFGFVGMQNLGRDNTFFFFYEIESRTLIARGLST